MGDLTEDSINKPLAMQNESNQGLTHASAITGNVITGLPCKMSQIKV